MATRACPGASGAEANVSRRKRSGGPSSRQTTAFGIRPRSLFAAAAPRGPAASGRCRNTCRSCRQRWSATQTRRAPSLHGLELILDRLLADACKEFLGIDADPLAYFRQHRVLRDVLVLAPIDLEHRARKRNHLVAQPDAAAHRLDAVDRKYRRPHLDRKACGARPVRHVFLLVVHLGRHRRFPRGIDAGVDGVEDAANQDRPPRNLDAEFFCQRLDVVEGEIGPRTGAVEEELDHGGVFPCYWSVCSQVDQSNSSFRDAPLGAGPESITTTGSMDSGLALRAPRNDGLLFLSRHLLRRLPEHILARLLVERLLDEFADRKPRLHLRPGADIRIPALDVGIIVERKPLRLVGHGPRKAGDIGDRIIAGDVRPGLAQLGVEHAIKPRRLVAVAFDRIGDFLRRVEREMAVLAEHGTEPAHLPHHPLHHPGAAAHILRQETSGLVGEIDQDGAGLEYRKRPAAVGRQPIDDRRNPIVRADREKFRLELLASPNVDRHDRVGKPQFLQHDRDFPAVRRRRVVKVDHGMILQETAAILACGTPPFQSRWRSCGPHGEHGTQAPQSEPTGRPPCCFQPRSQAPCRSRNGWPNPTRCGRPGSLQALNCPAPSATPPCWPSNCRRTPASILSPRASRRASISSTAFWRRSRASTSPTRSRWESARIATRRWCRRWWRRCG